MPPALLADASPGVHDAIARLRRMGEAVARFRPRLDILPRRDAHASMPSAVQVHAGDGVRLIVEAQLHAVLGHLLEAVRQVDGARPHDADGDRGRRAHSQRHALVGRLIDGPKADDGNGDEGDARVRGALARNVGQHLAQQHRPRHLRRLDDALKWWRRGVRELRPIARRSCAPELRAWMTKRIPSTKVNMHMR